MTRISPRSKQCSRRLWTSIWIGLSSAIRIVPEANVNRAATSSLAPENAMQATPASIVRLNHRRRWCLRVLSVASSYPTEVKYRVAIRRCPTSIDHNVLPVMWRRTTSSPRSATVTGSSWARASKPQNPPNTVPSVPSVDSVRILIVVRSTFSAMVDIPTAMHVRKGTNDR